MKGPAPQSWLSCERTDHHWLRRSGSLSIVTGRSCLRPASPPSRDARSNVTRECLSASRMIGHPLHLYGSTGSRSCLMTLQNFDCGRRGLLSDTWARHAPGSSESGTAFPARSSCACERHTLSAKPTSQTERPPVGRPRTVIVRDGEALPSPSGSVSPNSTVAVQPVETLAVRTTPWRLVRQQDACLARARKGTSLWASRTGTAGREGTTAAVAAVTCNLGRSPGWLHPRPKPSLQRGIGSRSGRPARTLEAMQAPKAEARERNA